MIPIYIGLAIIIFQLWCIYLAIDEKKPNKEKTALSPKWFGDGPEHYEKTQFVEPETLEDKFKGSEKIDEFLNKL